MVGTRKGAFILTSDGKRQKWDVSGPLFGGWEIYHLKGSPVDPNRIYASQTSGWFGQIIQRSDDGGKTWHQPGTPAGRADHDARRHAQGREQQVRLRHVAETGKPLTTHQWYDGTQHPWEFKRVWHLEPSLTDPEHGLRRRRRRGDLPLHRRRQELARAGRPARPRHGAAMVARRRRHGPAHDPARPAAIPNRIYIAISAAGAFRTDDGGKTWKPINRGLQVAVHSRPERRGRPLRAPHRACTRRGPTCCSCRSTGT